MFTTQQVKKVAPEDFQVKISIINRIIQMGAIDPFS